MKYTTSFRNSVLKKILPPSNRSETLVSKETGVAVVTINNWLGEDANHRICSLFLIRKKTKLISLIIANSFPDQSKIFSHF